MQWLLVKAVALLLTCIVDVTSILEVPVGYLTVENGTETHDLNNETMSPAMDMAAKVAEKQFGIRFKIHNVTTPDCGVVYRGDYVTGRMAQLHFLQNVSFFLGPGCTADIQLGAKWANFFGFPVVTGLGDFLNGKHRYPTVTRLSYDAVDYTNFLRYVLVEYGFAHSTVVTSVNLPHLWIGYRATDHVRQHIPRGITEVSEIEYSPDLYDKADVLKNASGYSRVIIFSMPMSVVREFMLVAHKLGMTTGEYAFIAVDFFFADSFRGNIGPWEITPDDGNNQIAKKAFESLMVVAMMRPYIKEAGLREFRLQVAETSMENYGNEITKPIHYFVTSHYDAVIYLAMAINRTIEDGGNIATTDPIKFGKKLWNTSIPTFLGDIFINAEGNADQGYILLDMTDVENGKYTVIAKREPANFDQQRTEFLRVPVWPQNGGPPVDMPRCGFKGDAPMCQPADTTLGTAIGASVGTMFVVLAIIAAYFIYRKIKYERHLARTLWEIKWSDIDHSGGAEDNMDDGETLYSTMPSQSHAPSASQESIPLFTTVGLYKGTQVAIRKFRFPNDTVVLTPAKQTELRQRAATKHQNLVPFIGGCIQDNKFCMLVLYCQKGSLEDILSNEVMKLDWGFKSSLINDVVRGMYFLHNSVIGVHGRLRSSNCVVDSQLVLRITDFGLASFYAENDALDAIHPSADEDTLNDDEVNSHTEYEEAKKKLWLSPERLKMEHLESTLPGDVYAFAIILQEIITRELPFANWGLEPKEIIERVKNCEDPPFRPHVSNDATSREILELMDQCWAEDETARPTFKNIRRTIKTITKKDHVKGTLVDRQLKQMTKYAENMESLVEERTNELMEEKTRAGELTYRGLPTDIVESLKEGEPVSPVRCESVTVYFGTLLDFPYIVSTSTPKEMVNFLHDYLHIFDRTISRYDVHKMQTRSDLFMIVAGVPTPTEANHASEVAIMSLSLMDATRRFMIRHLPAHKLELKAGISSGPCMTGVVGMEMPKFCVFGQPVAEACELEKTSKAMKTQISQGTEDILTQVGGFKMSQRGHLEVKDLGTVMAYWLDGTSAELRAASNEEVEIAGQVFHVSSGGDSEEMATAIAGHDPWGADASPSPPHLHPRQTSSEMVHEEMRKMDDPDHAHPSTLVETDGSASKSPHE